MKKQLPFSVPLLFFLILFNSLLNAQDKKITFDIGPVAGIPVGYKAKTSNAVFGAELTATLRVKNHFKIYSQTGYYYFMGKTHYDSNSGSALWKWRNIAHFPFYLGAKLDYEKFFIGMGGGYVKYGVLSGLGFNPQIGYKSGKLYYVANYSASTKFGEQQFSFAGLKCSYNF